MSKDISIADENGARSTIRNVDYLRTNGISGELATWWIPDAEAPPLASVTITENGEYDASMFGAYAIDRAEVNVTLDPPLVQNGYEYSTYIDTSSKPHIVIKRLEP